MSKKNKNINPECAYCSYPLRYNSKRCPNCGNPMKDKNKLTKTISGNNKLLSSMNEKAFSITCVDENNKLIDLNKLIKIKINPKTIKIEEIIKDVDILRPLNINNYLKNGDFLLLQNKTICKIKIEKK